MHDQDQERWLELCRQAAIEQDPQEPLKLVQEINRLLDEKQKLLKQQRTSRASDDAA